MADQPQTGKPGAPLTSVPNLNITSSDETAYEPGGFWRRWVANLLDSIIVGLLKAIIDIPLLLIMGLIFVGSTGKNQYETVGGVLRAIISFGVYLTIVYFYYGHFYSTKGATPGKSLMDLKVIDDKMGTFIDHRRSLNREVFGKLLSVITLGIGFIMAGLRLDKKALHDIVCDTRVVHLKKKA